MSDYAAPFRELAQQLDLTVCAPSEGAAPLYQVVVLDGAFAGVPVHVYRASTPSHQSVYVWVRASRRVPGDLDLSVARTNAIKSWLDRIFGSDRVIVDGLDERFAVKGAEPARVRAFFTPELCAALAERLDATLATARSHDSLLWGLWADDQHVYLELAPENWKWKLYDREVAVAELRAALETVTTLARALDAAQAQTPPSPAVAPHVDAWRSFAAAQGLDLVDSPLRITGAIGHRKIAARALVRGDGVTGLELVRPFAHPLPMFLEIKPGTRLDFYAWDPDGPHERSGDAAFDGAYSIVTTDAITTRALLTPVLRAALLASPVVIEPRGLVVELPDLRPEAMVAALDTLAPIETALREAGRPLG